MARAAQTESVRDSRTNSGNLKPFPASRNWHGANKIFMLKWLIIVSAIVVVAVGGFWFFHRGADNAPQYQTAAVARGDLTQAVTATGTLNPVVDVTVGSQVSGIITRLNVDYNSIVKSNEVIAEIDPSTYEAAVDQSKANLANAKANLELQQVELQRSAKLYTNNLISGSDYDTAVATRDEAAAQVQIQEASLTNALANLGYCKIRSPVDGVVIARDVDVGQTVASSFNTPTLFQIANSLVEMQIDTSVDEADIGGVKDGQTADFTVYAYPNRTFNGVVVQVRNAPTTVNNVVTYDTVIDVTNSDYSLKPGMTANVSIVVAQHDDVLEIPNSALRFQPPDTAVIETNALAAAGGQNTSNSNGESAGGHEGRRGGHGAGEHLLFHTVYVLVNNAAGKGDELKAVEIKTGITDNINTEVPSGLKEGDQVVTGLAIPGLTSDQGTKNPFAMGRHF